MFAETSTSQKRVALLGNANVGKSVLFGALSGRYVAVSNYPGTTVELGVGSVPLDGASVPLIDTPGTQSLAASSDDERVARDIALDPETGCGILVIDAKNLERGLSLVAELSEVGLPLVVDLNMADEAERRGISVDLGLLADYLGTPVVRTTAVRKEGIDTLLAAIAAARPAALRPRYPLPVEQGVQEISEELPGATRAEVLMVLAGDDELLGRLSSSVEIRDRVGAIRNRVALALGHPPQSAIQRARLHAARTVARSVTHRADAGSRAGERLARLTVHPFWGWPVLAVVLYVMYLFVGVLGASVLVDFFETKLFGAWINPWVTDSVRAWIPIRLVADFLVGEYGLVTMALTYAVAIVLPIVSTFFLAFSLLEDSGYLPRLALLLDRFFRRMGLNGKAVLPMVLGLGCDTMATMTTRILETRKERIQVTLLLALGVPCSAQLGVILGMLAGLSTGAVLVWMLVISGTMVAVGAISARLLPGSSSDFIIEIPPLRKPALSNIAVKTVARVEWYLKEVVPVFALGTAFLFVLAELDLLGTIERGLAPLVTGWLGLPGEVTDALLVGFLRRDYGAAGLFAVARTGAMDAVQITVSLIVVTLFMPCIANVLMIVKEYGARVAIGVAAVVFPLAFLIGGLVRLLLLAFPGLLF